MNTVTQETCIDGLKAVLRYCSDPLIERARDMVLVDGGPAAREALAKKLAAEATRAKASNNRSRMMSLCAALHAVKGQYDLSALSAACALSRYADANREVAK